MTDITDQSRRELVAAAEEIVADPWSHSTQGLDLAIYVLETLGHSALTPLADELRGFSAELRDVYPLTDTHSLALVNFADRIELLEKKIEERSAGKDCAND